MKVSNLVKTLCVGAAILSANAYADTINPGVTAARCSGVYMAVNIVSNKANDAATANLAARHGTALLQTSYAYLPQAQANQIAKDAAGTMTQSVANGHPENVVKMMQACDAWERTQTK